MWSNFGANQCIIDRGARGRSRSEEAEIASRWGLPGMGILRLDAGGA